MRYGTPSRPAHRATADGGLVLLVRGVGQHRPAVAPPLARLRPRPHRPRTRPQRHAARPRRVPFEPQRVVHLLTQGIAALILLGLTGMIGFLVLADRQAREPVTTLAPDLLGSRASDPAPLGLRELFPDDRQVRPAGADGPYRIAAHGVETDCARATTGELGAVLREHGCSQVVRAGLTAPYGGYRVTAGVFNLADAAGAAQVDDLLRPLVEGGDGGFATLPAADPAVAQMGWHVRGHFLLYCVISRPDGALLTADDPYAPRITAELVDGHLGGALLSRASGTAP